MDPEHLQASMSAHKQSPDCVACMLYTMQVHVAACKHVPSCADRVQDGDIHTCTRRPVHASQKP